MMVVVGFVLFLLVALAKAKAPCQIKWEACMDGDEGHRTPSETECDEIVFEKYGCKLPGGLPPPPQQQQDKEQKEKFDIRTKDRKIKEKERIFVKEDLVSMEETSATGQKTVVKTNPQIPDDNPKGGVVGAAGGGAASAGKIAIAKKIVDGIL